MRAIWIFVFWIGFLATSSITLALSPTETELRDLAKAVAPHVSFFRAVWEIDSKAEFYAGTTRDFLYWILGHFKNAQTSEDVTKIKEALLQRRDIDIRYIVGPDSDIDVMTRRKDQLAGIEFRDYGVRKLDLVNFDRLDPATIIGRTEVDQGYIPIEKLRLSREYGLNLPDVFGNGVEELISGKLSIKFGDPNIFWSTYYASKGMNHPVLLAARFARLLAQDYFNRYGSSYPDEKLLLGHLDFHLRQQIRDVISESFSDPHFRGFIQNESGRKWLNAALLKSFRSHTNPTAAFETLKYFGLDQLIAAFPDLIQPINQFLFLEKRDPTEIQKNFDSVGLAQSQVFERLPQYFPEAKAYHGAGSYEAFRAMIFQGVIPSETGSAGSGFYIVGNQNIPFAENWAKNRSGRSDLVVEVELSKEAKLTDITQGNGLLLYDRWLGLHPELKDASERFTLFARAFGIDILCYPYGDMKAFVVKNSAVIQSNQGLYVKLKSLEDILSEARALSAQALPSFLSSFVLGSGIPAETARVISEIPNHLLETSLDDGLLKQAIQSLPTAADRAKVSETLWKGALRWNAGSSLSQKLRELFDQTLAEEKQKFENSSSQEGPSDDFLSSLTWENKFEWFEKTKSVSVKQKLITTFVAKSEWTAPQSLLLDKALERALNEKDPLTRFLSAQYFLFKFDQTLEEKNAVSRRAIEIYFSELQDPTSPVLKMAVKDFTLSASNIAYRHPEVVSYFANLLDRVSNPRIISLLLDWLRDNSDLKAPKEFSEQIRRFFPNPKANFLRFINHPNPVVQMRAFAGYLSRRFMELHKNSPPRLNRTDRLASDALLKALETSKFLDSSRLSAPFHMVRGWISGNARFRGFQRYLLRGVSQAFYRGAYDALSDHQRAILLKAFMPKDKKSPQYAQQFLDLYRKQKSDKFKTEALGFYLSNARQDRKSLPYFTRLVLRLNSPEAEERYEALTQFQEVSKKLSSVFLNELTRLYAEILDPEYKIEILEVLFESTSPKIIKRFYPELNVGDISVQNTIALGLIESESPHFLEAFEKLLLFLTDRVDKRDFPDVTYVASGLELLAVQKAVDGVFISVRNFSRLIPNDAVTLAKIEKVAASHELRSYAHHSYEKVFRGFISQSRSEDLDHCKIATAKLGKVADSPSH